mgnify:CR=1 FL=1
MEFVITEYKHCDLVEIIGRIDSYSAPKIEEALNAFIADNHYHFVIDLNKTSYISSSGILSFVNIQKRFINQNRGKIVFSCVPERILNSFKLAGFDRLFEFYEDTVSAVGRF